VDKYKGFHFNWDFENVSEYSVLTNQLRKYMQNGKTMLNLTKFRQNFHAVWVKMMANLFRGGISVQFFLKRIGEYDVKKNCGS
jgi:hypothetical protein